MAWLADGRGSRDPVEPVVPLCEQLRAQHKRATETSLALLSAWAAFLQQSMSATLGMLHCCSLECSGIPADRPPDINSTSTNDVKRMRITFVTLLEHLNSCQGPSPRDLLGRPIGCVNTMKIKEV